jgi:phage tail-like protein
MAIDPNQVSGLLDSLPAVFQEDREGRAPNFLGRFLLGFEQVLLGFGDADEPGLEETIAHIYRYFEPGAALAPGERAPREFLHWLAGWVALTLREDWDELRQRDLISKAVPLYRLRGTRRGVEEFLRIYTRLGVRIDELSTAFQVGVHSTIGEDTRLDGGPAFFFRVPVPLPSPQPEEMKAQLTVARAIVDLQKPAHTDYSVDPKTPVFRIDEHSRVGVDTLLGEET